MDKTLKKVLVLGGLVFAVYKGFRLYKLYEAMSGLNKSLPGVVESLCGEAPKVSCKLQVNWDVVVSVVVRLSPESIATFDELEDVVRKHIADNYPQLAKYKLSVLIIDNTLSTMDMLKKYYPQIKGVVLEQIEKYLNKVKAAKEEQSKPETEE